MVQKGVKIEAPSGKLGVLIPGLGAVSTTFISGVEAIKKKIAQPVDVASVVVFLASDEAGWITGDTMHVDGGSRL